MKKLTVEIKQELKEYDILIGYDIIEDIAAELYKRMKGNKIIIITDSNVKSLWVNEIQKKFKNSDLITTIIEFPAGENSKTRKTKEIIEDKLFKLKCDRNTSIIALGGGVVGDVAGFVAATYMRGVDYYQMPTTVIAQADSSIGGKTGIDVGFGKNLIGAFHQPKAVFIDTKFLETLDNKNFSSGFVEILKHGLIKNRAFFDYINKNLDEIIERKPDSYKKLLVELLLKNCKIKKEVVSLDDKELGLRKILNYGHTVGHAIELLMNFSILHGEAIGMGIVCESYMSWKLGFSSYEDYIQQKNVIEKLGIDTKILKTMDLKQLCECMILDKKSQNGNLEFVMLEKIGRIKMSINDKYTLGITKDKVYELLEDYREL